MSLTLAKGRFRDIALSVVTRTLLFTFDQQEMTAQERQNNR